MYDTLTNITLRLRLFFTDWGSFVSKPYNLLNVVVSLLFLQAAYLTTQFAAMLATRDSTNEVYDVVFAHIPRIDTSFIHGDVSFFLYDLRLPLFLLFITYTPFAAKALASLLLVRAVTINLTNVGMPPGIVPISSDITFGGDLFFSGHVANMVMLGLVFWPIKPLRYFFFAMSIIFGISAVLGHYHYTLDVVAAPFFAYGVFVFCKRVFAKDYRLIVGTEVTS